MLPREQREQLELTMIGPDGVLSARSKGRARPEPECDVRTCFQRDVDRVTHSKAFRRLKHGGPGLAFERGPGGSHRPGP